MVRAQTFAMGTVEVFVVHGAITIVVDSVFTVALEWIDFDVTAGDQTRAILVVAIDRTVSVVVDGIAAVFFEGVSIDWRVATDVFPTIAIVAVDVAVFVVIDAVFTILCGRRSAATSSPESDPDREDGNGDGATQGRPIDFSKRTPRIEIRAEIPERSKKIFACDHESVPWNRSIV